VRKTTIGRLKFEFLEQRHCLAANVFVETRLVPSTSAAITVSEVADIDGDGDLDLLAAHLLNPALVSPGDIAVPMVMWFENLGTRFAEGKRIDVEDFSSGVWSLETVDMDHDGDLDLVMATRESDYDSRTNLPGEHRIAWYENQGLGHFSQRTIIDEPVLYGGGLVAGDIDGDGDPDLLASGTYHESIEWYENVDGIGKRFEHHVMETDLLVGWALRPWSQAFSLSDMDADSDLDIVAATSIGVYWYENIDGKGHFDGNEYGISSSFDAIAVHVEDFDVDGDLDVISGGRTFQAEGKFSYHENIGRGDFAEEVVLANTREQVESIAAADVDQDGDRDLIYATWYDELRWLENDNGQFSREHIIPNIPREQFILIALPRQIVPNDFDQDGDIDFIYSSWMERKLTLLESRIVGDVNDDGVFNSTDLVLIFQANKYEDGIDRNATFEDGDWNQDGDFDSSDLVFAFQTGNYVAL
jgi:hypothetical protein